MSTKADCQTAMTALKASLVILQKEEDEKKSHGPDERERAVVDVAAKIAIVDTNVEGLP